MTILPNFQLKDHNTLSLSSVAAYLVDLTSVQDALILASDEYFRSIPFVFIGGGSNLLFAGDFKGAVIHYSGKEIEILDDSDTAVIIKVGAGYNWHQLVMECVEKGLWGIENLALIPGEAGAAAVQNIGAYGREVCEVLAAVHVVDLLKGETRRMLPSECNFGYRHSIFKEEGQGHLLVTDIELRLSKEPAPCLAYAGLKGLREEPSLTPLQVANTVIQIRESKLPDPRLIPNAGSFFMNPIIDGAHFSLLQTNYPTMPHYKVEEGYKIPAAWLIEQIGYKGHRVGDVGTYKHQPLVIVNHGQAEAHEIIAFAEEIQSKIQEEFGIAIHPEVRYIRSVLQYSLNQLS